MSLKQGVLIVLERDDAKAFFGQREDAARLEFINAALERADIVAKSLSGNWQATHEALTSIDLEESFLDQCILGGRPMHQADDYRIVLVRPDIAAFIAEQLTQIEESSLPPGVVDDVKVVAEAYKTAAERKAAVVFAAQS